MLSRQPGERQRLDVMTQGGSIGVCGTREREGGQDRLPDQYRRGHEEKRDRGGDPNY